MGCQIKAYGADVELNYSRAAYGVMRLADRWLDQRRDCDSDGCYQERIDKTSMAKLNSEAPTDVVQFRAYCVTRLGEKAARELDDDDLLAMRDFITQADWAGFGVSCSY